MNKKNAGTDGTQERKKKKKNAQDMDLIRST
jgi:hypothetical protein